MTLLCEYLHCLLAVKACTTDGDAQASSCAHHSMPALCCCIQGTAQQCQRSSHPRTCPIGPMCRSAGVYVMNT